MKISNGILCLVLLAGILSLAACGSGGSPLAGTSWVLESYEGPMGHREALQETEVTLNFGDNGGLGGNASCNSYGGSYTVSGKAGIEITELFQTLMYCVEEGVMEQEESYMQALGKAATFKVVGSTLTISGGGWKVTLVKTAG